MKEKRAQKNWRDLDFRFGEGLKGKKLGRLVNAWTALTAPQSKAVDLSNLILPPSSSGITVSETTALKSSAVYACTRVLSESLAMLPIHLHRLNSEGHREKATGHAVDKLIRKSPNVRMTPFEFWRFMMLQAVVWNGAYAEIVRGAMRARRRLRHCGNRV